MEVLLVLALALALDLAAGDPRNRFHPTAWIGRLIGVMVPRCKTGSPYSERALGVVLVCVVTGIVMSVLVAINAGAGLVTGYVGAIISVAMGVVLLKCTIAMRGMEEHAKAVLKCLEAGDIESARGRLAGIVKRDTENLDEQHVLSGVLESISENTVDGVTGPLFYFGFFGIFGAFAYRTISTFDSMIGYRTEMFGSIGWFAANCDKILSYAPARLTALAMILGALVLRTNWRDSYRIVLRDGSKPDSPNSGYPIAALAGALDATLEKQDCYKIGSGGAVLRASHVRQSIRLMKTASILFCGMVTVPAAAVLYGLGWWLHA